MLKNHNIISWDPHVTFETLKSIKLDRCCVMIPEHIIDRLVLLQIFYSVCSDLEKGQYTYLLCLNLNKL